MIVHPEVRWPPWIGNHQNSSTLTSGDQEMVPVCLGTPIPAVFPRFPYNNRSCQGSGNLAPTSFPNSDVDGFCRAAIYFLCLKSNRPSSDYYPLREHSNIHRDKSLKAGLRSGQSYQKKYGQTNCLGFTGGRWECLRIR